MKLLVDLEWTLQAACRGVKPETFFPTKQGIETPEVRDAIAICLGCPVRQTCLEFALDHEGTHTTYRYGIYGGLTPRQRNALARRTTPLAVRHLARTAAPADVRAWAIAAGYDRVSPRKLPHALRLAYAEAHIGQAATA